MLIKDSAYHGQRGLPSAAELDALDLSAEARRRVKEACAEAAATHDSGHHADAWAQGDRAAAEVISDLDSEQRDPGYRDRPEDLTGLGPEELAAKCRAGRRTRTGGPDEQDQDAGLRDHRGAEHLRGGARARARERVARVARRGEDPRARHTEGDLRWAFRGREGELGELEELAARTRDEQAERKRRAERSRELQAMTAKVLEEWDAGRRREAEQEARRRLDRDGER